MKKKLQKKETVSETYRGGFLTYMDYFATGEGRTVELNFCYADCEEEALQKHLYRFYPNNKSAQNYFGVGVDVFEIKSREAKDLLTDMFNRGQGMWKAMCEAGVEFHMKFYFNYS